MKFALTVSEALDYCFNHRDEFIKEHSEEDFDNIIKLLEWGMINPDELSDYGMDYD